MNGKRMIVHGTDGLSRVNFTMCTMHGMSMSEFIDLVRLVTECKVKVEKWLNK